MLLSIPADFFVFVVSPPFDLSKYWALAAGYRMLEGGADVDSVFSFAWRHYATASIAARF